MSVRNLFGLFLLSIALHLFTVSSPLSNPEQLELVMKVSDTLVTAGDSGYVSVYMDTYNSEIFGFQFVLRSSRPDLVLFDFSGAGYDSTGTLVENFEYKEVIDKASNQSEYWFRCIADIFGVTGNVSGILPQQGGIVIRIPYLITASPDTTLSLTSQLTFEIPTDFSDPIGNSLGVIPDTVVDTSYYNCTLWNNAVCSTWVEVVDTLLGYDFVHYDSTVIGLLDSNIVKVIDGSITVKLPTTNGFLNCDINSDLEIDIADLVLMVQCMFIDATSCDFSSFICDFNDDQSLDIADLVGLVAYMFTDGPPPPEL